MATKLISSKPEELRMYIEEVAGISVYRERKRETESRIKKKRKNILKIIILNMMVNGKIKNIMEKANYIMKLEILYMKENF